MKRVTKLATLTNAALAILLLAVGIVCFLPIGISTAGKLSDRVYYSGNTDSKYVSVMINVYWGTEYIPAMLDVLDEYGAKATFFVGGSWADDHTETLREIVRCGHELGNHGYFHKDQDKLNYEKNAEEIRLCGELVERLTDVKMNLFAPPSGAYSENTVDAAEELGYKVILWSKDTVDWRDRDQTLIYRRATENVAGGDLVLMHPTAETASALPSILDYYKKQELQVVPVSENISGIEKV
ncbi:MAG TPA: polysaccharide deacetylase family protein [Candidatus Borkfalkia excrementipullorum]|nr:polysaccharide deacetylase family protein [Candidatus Borkfalkia excrementipullorum]